MTSRLGSITSFLSNFVLGRAGGTTLVVAASNILALSQAATGTKVLHVSASNVLSLSQSAAGTDTTVHAATDFLELTQEVDLETTLHVKHCNWFNDWPIHRKVRNMKIISISQAGFHEPGQLCKIGETVKFVNDDTVTHTITGPFDTFDLAPKAEKELALTKPGLHTLASNKFTRTGHLNVQT